MGQPSSPSPPHRSKSHPDLHVDIRVGKGVKLHVPVKNPLGATAIGGTVRAQERKAKGRP